MKRLWLSSALFFCSLLPLTLTAQTLIVEDIRIIQTPGNTRLLLDLNKSIDSHLWIEPKNSRKKSLQLKAANLSPKAMRKIAKLRLEQSALSKISFEKKGQKIELSFLTRKIMPSRALALSPQGRFGHRLMLEFGQTLSQAKVAPLTNQLQAKLPMPVRVPLKSIAPVGQFVIAIDAGHGGHDPGAIGRSGTQEKKVTLAVALQLARLIEQEPMFRAVLIRTGDYYMGLKERVAKARLHRADLFISIHADAFHNRAAQGASIFTLSSNGASTAAARWLAERENRSELIGGLQLSGKNKLLDSVLLDLSQVASQKASVEAAQLILRSLGQVAPLHRPRVDQAGFAVLKAPDMPSLLIETGFLTNSKSEARLNNPRHQRQIAQAVLNGIRHYFNDKMPILTKEHPNLNAKPNSTLAQLPRQSNSRRGGH